MDNNKMPFLEVVRGHTHSWTVGTNFRSQFSQFEKNSSFYHSELDNNASIAFIIERK